MAELGWKFCFGPLGHESSQKQTTTLSLYSPIVGPPESFTSSHRHGRPKLSPYPSRSLAKKKKKSFRMRHLLLPAPRQASPPTTLALSHSAGSGPQIPALPMAARTQAWQFAAALVFFHGSEYVLAAAFHGHRNVTATCECPASSFPPRNSRRCLWNFLETSTREDVL